MRVLGVSCSTSVAFLSLVNEGEITDAHVQRIEVGSLLEASEELEATLGELHRAFVQLRPELVVVLLPEQSPSNKRTYAEIAPRVALETLVRLAAVRTGVPVDLLSRPTVRARLQLPRKGDLASYTSEVISTPVGKYWAAGRNVAALAALAGGLQ